MIYGEGLEARYRLEDEIEKRTRRKAGRSLPVRLKPRCYPCILCREQQNVMTNAKGSAKEGALAEEPPATVTSREDGVENNVDSKEPCVDSEAPNVEEGSLRTKGDEISPVPKPETVILIPEATREPYQVRVQTGDDHKIEKHFAGRPTSGTVTCEDDGSGSLALDQRSRPKHSGRSVEASRSTQSEQSVGLHPGSFNPTEIPSRSKVPARVADEQGQWCLHGHESEPAALNENR
jgi:hypothetical protein